jgi:hypothetical protein
MSLYAVTVLCVGVTGLRTVCAIELPSEMRDIWSLRDYVSKLRLFVRTQPCLMSQHAANTARSPLRPMLAQTVPVARTLFASRGLHTDSSPAAVSLETLMPQRLRLGRRRREVSRHARNMLTFM